MFRSRAAASAAAALAVGALALSGCTAASDSGAIAVTVDLGDCGRAWSAPRGGVVTFAITNGFRDSMDVYLANARTGAVYQEWEGIGSKATLAASATLGDGRYRLVCFPNDNPSVYGPTTTISGADPALRLTAGVLPVSNAMLVPIAKAYQAWVTARLPTLLAQTKALAEAVKDGSSPAAKTDWLRAHLTYETLGAAYDAFGDLDGEINGDGTGFHEVEALLWSNAPATRIEKASRSLSDAVAALSAQLQTTDIDPNIIALRAHEIVENAIQFELNGYTDAGSHTNLATISANLQGAAKTLSLLTPVLADRYPQLPQTEAALAAAQHLVSSFDHGSAADPTAWTPLSALTTARRAGLNASMEALVELLAPVAAICDTRQVPE